jgi:hypothetical protein
MHRREASVRTIPQSSREKTTQPSNPQLPEPHVSTTPKAKALPRLPPHVPSTPNSPLKPPQGPSQEPPQKPSQQPPQKPPHRPSHGPSQKLAQKPAPESPKTSQNISRPLLPSTRPTLPPREITSDDETSSNEDEEHAPYAFNKFNVDSEDQGHQAELKQIERAFR